MLIWFMQSVPREILEDYKMSSMTLEFRRECTQSDILESMTSPSSKVIGASNNKCVSRKPHLQYIHLLRLQENKTELVRARTEWHLKQNHNWYAYECNNKVTCLKIEMIPQIRNHVKCVLQFYFLHCVFHSFYTNKLRQTNKLATNCFSFVLYRNVIYQKTRTNNI